jgi:SAM-dependent methyltransferase
MDTTLSTDLALRAYERMAPFYDLFTQAYDHERFLANIDAMVREHGLRGTRLLDIGCGTGKSFLPMLRRGYDVVACDLSRSMVEAARRALVPPLRAQVLVADMRDLPSLGRFDLVTCLDDGLNYLLSDGDFEAAIEGVARNLRRAGLFVFDLNTLGTYRRFFTKDVVTEVDDALFCWRGDGGAEPGPGCTSSARIEIFAQEQDGWQRTTTTHVQRHHPPEFVRDVLAAAGFEVVLVHGQLDAARIDVHADDDYHVKLLYLARKR